MTNLGSIPTGGQVLLDHFKDTLENAERLRTMGMIKGETLTVIRNERHMPLVIRFKGTDIMLGRSLCSSIYVDQPDSK